MYVVVPRVVGRRSSRIDIDVAHGSMSNSIDACHRSMEGDVAIDVEVTPSAAPSLTVATMGVSSSWSVVGTPVRDARARHRRGTCGGGVGVVRVRASAGRAEREQFRMRFVRSFVVVCACVLIVRACMIVRRSRDRVRVE